MRISDWSSDVCSSDLVSDTFTLGTGTTATFQVNVPVQPTVNGREASAGRLHLRVLQPANATLSVQSWNSIDSGEYGKGWRIDVSGGSTGYRSEEHTSALQSLMRISYAVFSLKKTTNKH